MWKIPCSTLPRPWALPTCYTCLLYSCPLFLVSNSPTTMSRSYGCLSLLVSFLIRMHARKLVCWWKISSEGLKPHAQTSPADHLRCTCTTNVDEEPMCFPRTPGSWNIACDSPLSSSSAVIRADTWYNTNCDVIQAWRRYLCSPMHNTRRPFRER